MSHDGRKPEADPSLVVSVVFAGADLDMLLEIMRASGWATPTGAIFGALWMSAKHHDLHPQHDVFRVDGRPRRKKQPQQLHLEVSDEVGNRSEVDRSTGDLVSPAPAAGGDLVPPGDRTGRVPASPAVHPPGAPKRRRANPLGGAVRPL